MTTRVACIGDSLTWGFSLPDSWRQSYPALLQERLGADYVVRNFGCNGASVRFDADLPSQPRVILIAPIRMFRVMGGTFGGLSPETLEDGVRPVIREVAGECGLPCIDLVDLFMDARYCYDGVHPNGEGTRLMVEQICLQIQ